MIKLIVALSALLSMALAQVAIAEDVVESHPELLETSSSVEADASSADESGVDSNALERGKKKGKKKWGRRGRRRHHRRGQGHRGAFFACKKAGVDQEKRQSLRAAFQDLKEELKPLRAEVQQARRAYRKAVICDQGDEAIQSAAEALADAQAPLTVAKKIFAAKTAVEVFGQENIKPALRCINAHLQFSGKKKRGPRGGKKGKGKRQPIKCD